MSIYLAKVSKAADDWYRVAFVSEFIHPVTKKVVKLSLEKFQAWAEWFSHLKDLGESIPLVKNHSFDPTERLGSVKNVQILDNDFYIQASWKDDETKLAVAQSSFSIYSSDEVQTFEGKTFPHALLHVGVTDYPVLLGLRKDLKTEAYLSREFDLPQEEKIDMDFSELLEALGLAKTATPQEALAKFQAVKANETRLSTELTEQKEKVTKLSQVLTDSRIARVESLSCKDEEKAKLKKFCTVEHTVADALSGEESLFDTALSMIPSADSLNDEDFLSGQQHGRDEENFLADACKALS